jgi:hypothetical protein
MKALGILEDSIRAQAISCEFRVWAGGKPHWGSHRCSYPKADSTVKSFVK